MYTYTYKHICIHTYTLNIQYIFFCVCDSKSHLIYERKKKKKHLLKCNAPHCLNFNLLRLFKDQRPPCYCNTGL